MERQAKKKIITATLIVNPVSGQGNPTERRKLLQRTARELGWKGKYIETTKEIPAEKIAKAAVAKGATHIIVCGGDGTIMEVLEAISYHKVVLGIVPLGTGNLLARNLSLPLDTKKAMEIALFGNQQVIDVGCANGTYFSIIAGIGLDAEVMHAAKREMKDRWGLLAYVVTTLKNLQNRSAIYEVSLDKKVVFTVRAKSIMVSNMGKLVSGVDIVPATDPQSGTLNLGIIKARSPKAWINIFLHALSGKIDNSPHYDIYTAKHIVIRSLSGKRYYQCDGNHFPPTDSLVIDIFPHAIPVMVKPDVLRVPAAKIKKVLLFDFDGTLADTLAMVLKIYNELAHKHKYPQITPEKREELRGLSAREVMNRLPISKLHVPILYLEGRKAFAQNLEFIKPFPTLPQILSQLAEKYTLGIVTSNDAANVKKFLINHNMDYFDFVYSDGSLFGKGKVITNVLKKYKFAKKDVTYIGDEIRDIDAAREAGVCIVSVTWGFNSENALKSHKPDFIIHKPAELATLAL